MLVLCAQLIKFSLEFPLKIASVVGANGADAELFWGDICRDIALY